MSVFSCLAVTGQYGGGGGVRGRGFMTSLAFTVSLLGMSLQVARVPGYFIFSVLSVL